MDVRNVVRVLNIPITIIEYEIFCIWFIVVVRSWCVVVDDMILSVNMRYKHREVFFFGFDDRYCANQATGS